ncbi:hypothetical protein K435DRAFT_868583 [Dendrothele bispora CBS 962.96]|uniref:Uncharacterized protein n=1 Tax=Dendrothele bispora (strain CBS 962.96) TaxID=1314807 RepID=A0A4S8LBC8_DENBC|nr:hypothetical protein K435DRAFT_868583 [Dendrothele bispora CBS 962.96]
MFVDSKVNVQSYSQPNLGHLPLVIPFLPTLSCFSPQAFTAARLQARGLPIFLCITLAFQNPSLLSATTCSSTTTSYPDHPGSPGSINSHRLINRNTNRYGVTTLFSMAAEQDVAVEDDLARDLKGKILLHPKRTLSSKGMSAILTHGSLLFRTDEQREVEQTLEEVDPTEGHHPDDCKLQQYSNLFLLQSGPCHVAALCRFLSTIASLSDCCGRDAPLLEQTPSERPLPKTQIASLMSGEQQPHSGTHRIHQNEQRVGSQVTPSPNSFKSNTVQGHVGPTGSQVALAPVAPLLTPVAPLLTSRKDSLVVTPPRTSGIDNLTLLTLNTALDSDPLWLHTPISPVVDALTTRDITFAVR